LLFRGPCELGHDTAFGGKFGELSETLTWSVAPHQNAKREMTAKVSGQRDFFSRNFQMQCSVLCRDTAQSGTAPMQESQPIAVVEVRTRCVTIQPHAPQPPRTNRTMQ
jgi:hypothetical protein